MNTVKNHNGGGPVEASLMNGYTAQVRCRAHSHFAEKLHTMSMHNCPLVLLWAQQGQSMVTSSTCSIMFYYDTCVFKIIGTYSLVYRKSSWRNVVPAQWKDDSCGFSQGPLSSSGFPSDFVYFGQPKFKVNAWPLHGTTVKPFVAIVRTVESNSCMNCIHVHKTAL